MKKILFTTAALAIISFIGSASDHPEGTKRIALSTDGAIHWEDPKRVVNDLVKFIEGIGK